MTISHNLLDAPIMLVGLTALSVDMSMNLSTPAMIAANPMAALAVIPCAISCAYHSISGTLLAGFFLWKDTRRQQTK